LVRVLVVYDSKYGNTKLAAENVVEGLKQASGVEAAILNVKETNANDIVNYDALVFGAPNHMASPSRTMKKFVSTLVGMDLKATKSAVFGTYSGRSREDRAVKKLEKMVGAKLPKTSIVLPGLSVRVRGVTGPIVDGELKKAVDFGKKIADLLEAK